MIKTTTHSDHVGGQPRQPSRHPYTGPDEERGRPMTRHPEALARADRIQIALLAGLFALLAAILGAGALAYTSLSGQLLAIQQHTHEELTEVREELGELRTEVREEIAELRTEVREELAELRAGMQRLSDRVARIEALIEARPGALPGP